MTESKSEIVTTREVILNTKLLKKSIGLHYMVLNTRSWQRVIFERHEMVPDCMGLNWERIGMRLV